RPGPSLAHPPPPGAAGGEDRGHTGRGDGGPEQPICHRRLPRGEQPAHPAGGRAPAGVDARHRTAARRTFLKHGDLPSLVFPPSSPPCWVSPSPPGSSGPSALPTMGASTSATG